MIYGYARVSTTAQSLGEQLERLKEAGVSEQNIYKEKFTGTKKERPEFSKLLERLDKFDTVIVTKLDRFARNTKEALEIIEPLLERHITINVLNLGTIEDTPIGRIILRTLLSVAEMERDMIVERTQEGKDFAKRNNPQYKEGRPKARITPDKQHAYDLLQQGMSYKDVSKKTRLSISTIQRVKRQIEQKEAANFK